MQTIFEKLNELIYQQTSTVKAKQLSDTQKDILAEAKSLPDLFTSSFLKKCEKEAMSATVQLSQSGASLLLNRIYVFKEQTPSIFYDQLEKLLVDFIHFLSRNFPAYFDYQLPMPQTLWLPIAESCSQQFKRLREQGVEADLVALIQDELPVYSATSAHDYAQGFYWQNLCIALSQTKQETDLLTNEVLEILLTNNFNTEHFIHYMIIWCVGGLDEEDTPEQFWIKVLTLAHRVPIIESMKLNLNGIDSKKMLIKAIAQELTLVESAAAEETNTTKINTGLSVGQFAALIRVMVEAGILQTENISTLTRFFGKHFKTARTNEIAEANLYRKYYQVDKASANILRTHLYEMMNRLKQL